MDLPKLKHAIAVATAGNYGAAALKLNLSQPALSRSIQALEAEYGLRIFERGRAGAMLTPAGAEFITIAYNIIQRASVGDEQLRQVVSGKGRPVNFGLGPITAAVALPGVLPRIVADGTEVRVRIESVAMLQSLIRQGEIEFYLSGIPLGIERQATGREFQVRHVGFSGLGLVVREGHPLLRSAQSADDLRRYPTASGSFLRELVAKTQLAQLGLHPPSVELDDYGMLAALARESDYILIATTLLGLVRPDLGLVPLGVTLPVDGVSWGLVSSQEDPLSATAARVADLLFDHLTACVTDHDRQVSAPSQTA